jgi:hypothetical protein
VGVKDLDQFPSVRTPSQALCQSVVPLALRVRAPTFLALAHPFADFGKPPIIASIVAKLDWSREGNLRVSLPTPKRHVGYWDDRPQLFAVDIAVL